MGLPVACIEICETNGISAMEHHPITHINADMGNAGGVVCADEKHKVAGLRGGCAGADVTKALRSKSAHIPSAVIDYP